MLTELEIQTFEDNKYTVCIYITSLWILNDVISNMISTHLHLLKVNERIQLLSANLHYASYHPLHFTVHRNTKEGERTSIFKLHYYIIVHTGWVKKKWDLKKFQIALTHSILKLKSIVIPLNKMSQSGEKHA